MIREEILISNFIPGGAAASPVSASGSSIWKWILFLLLIAVVLWFILKPKNQNTG